LSAVTLGQWTQNPGKSGIDLDRRIWRNCLQSDEREGENCTTVVSAVRVRLSPFRRSKSRMGTGFSRRGCIGSRTRKAHGANRGASGSSPGLPIAASPVASLSSPGRRSLRESTVLVGLFRPFPLIELANEAVQAPRAVRRRPRGDSERKTRQDTPPPEPLAVPRERATVPRVTTEVTT
jgi:hypothetical protein